MGRLSRREYIVPALQFRNRYGHIRTYMDMSECILWVQKLRRYEILQFMPYQKAVKMTAPTEISIKGPSTVKPGEMIEVEVSSSWRCMRCCKKKKMIPRQTAFNEIKAMTPTPPIPEHVRNRTWEAVGNGLTFR